MYGERYIPQNSKLVPNLWKKITTIVNKIYTLLPTYRFNIELVIYSSE